MGTHQQGAVRSTKTAPPRLAAVVNRERLFQRLDAAMARPLVWISGPAGAGKTTLAASYLSGRRERFLWYQCDARDADIATFFHYLGEAVQHALPEPGEPLPHLTPEYLGGLSAFAHRFFEAMFQRMGAPTVLVLDDCHCIPQDARLYLIISDALARPPEGCNVVFVSREQPPPAFARLRANQALSVIGWEELRLTREECGEITRLLSPERSLTDEGLSTLELHSQGWAAGLVLLLQQAEGRAYPATPGQQDYTLIFDYFAGEILQRQEGALQEFLLRTAFLSKIRVSIAERLTGNPQAERILAQLARGNYFTFQHSDDPQIYLYHPLFRHFLQHRAAALLSPAELEALQRQSAVLLAEAGDPESAADLAMAVQDWDTLARLVLDHARFLRKQGRQCTLNGWLQALPPERVEANPWLLFWRATSLQVSDPGESRQQYALSFARFKDANDAAGIYLSWLAAVDSCLFVWGDFQQLDYWLAEFREVERRGIPFPNLEIEARITYGMINVIMRRQPDSKCMTYWRERGEFMLQQPIGPTYKMLIATSLMLFYVRWIGDLHRGARLRSMVQPVVENPTRSPLTYILAKANDAAHYWISGEPEAGIAAIEDGLREARDSGAHLIDPLLYISGICATIGAGDTARTAHYLDSLAACIHQLVNADFVNQYYMLIAMAALEEDDLPRARELCELAWQRISQAEHPMGMSYVHITYAQILVEYGEDDRAMAVMAGARRWATRVGSPLKEFHGLIVEAESALRRGLEDESMDLLRQAIAIARAQGYLVHPYIGWRRPLLARLYCTALARGVEVDYVQRIVRTLRLAPIADSVELPHWPWAIRIRTFGRFSVEVDGRAIDGQRRTRGKPMELLMALVAFGGRGVSECKIAETLWPDADGDAAHHSFETTLYRLRKMIGNDKAITLLDGLVSLDPHHCWVDTWALDSVLRRLKQAFKDGADPALLADLQARLLELYRGDFLPSAAEDPWCLAVQEQYRSEAMQQLARLSRHWERLQRQDLASEASLRGRKLGLWASL